MKKILLSIFLVLIAQSAYAIKPEPINPDITPVPTAVPQNNAATMFMPNTTIEEQEVAIQRFARVVRYFRLYGSGYKLEWYVNSPSIKVSYTVTCQDGYHRVGFVDVANEGQVFQVLEDAMYLCADAWQQ